MIKEEKLEHQKKLKTWQAKIWVYAMGFSHLEFSKLIIVKITQGILNIEEILKTEKAIKRDKYYGKIKWNTKRLNHKAGKEKEQKNEKKYGLLKL